MSDDMDLEVLAQSFAEVLAAEWPREKAIAHAQKGTAGNGALWATVAGLGWTALTVPEAEGGLGLGLTAAARLHFALGAAAAPLPMIGTTLAVALLVAEGSAGQRAKWLPGIADGSLRVAVDLADASGALDAETANLFLVRAQVAGVQGWNIVEGAEFQPIALADRSRTMGRLKAADSTGDFVADPGEVVLRYACAALAADAVGGGEAVLAETVEYLKVREQFDRQIGSFQALKHRVADHQAALVAARELVEHAAALGDADPEALLYALSAKQHAARITAEIARDCIQLHGGVGFTSEFFPHIYLKRAKLNEALFGTRAALLDRIADMLEAA